MTETGIFGIAAHDASSGKSVEVVTTGIFSIN